jgi:hypothetical protein
LSRADHQAAPQGCVSLGAGWRWRCCSVNVTIEIATPEFDRYGKMTRRATSLAEIEQTMTGLNHLRKTNAWHPLHPIGWRPFGVGRIHAGEHLPAEIVLFDETAEAAKP